MTDLAGCIGLFVTALTAATILPIQSEAALAGLLIAGALPPLLLIAVASTGNVIGSVVNWWIGREIERFRNRRWFPVKARMFERAEHLFRRYGRWSLLLSWVPIIGDPITIVAGALREPLWRFVAVVALAKTLRYGAVAAGTLSWV